VLETGRATLEGAAATRLAWADLVQRRRRMNAREKENVLGPTGAIVIKDQFSRYTDTEFAFPS